MAGGLTTFTATPGYAEGLLNYQVAKEIMPSLMRASGSLYETAMEGLPVIGAGGNVDTIAVNVIESLFDHNTYGNPPTPAIDRGTGVVTQSTSSMIVRHNVSHPLAWFTGSATWDTGTEFITGGKVNPTAKKALLQKGCSDWMKLMVRTFDPLTANATYNVYGNAAASEAALTSALLYTDIVSAFQILDNNNWPVITEVMDVRNNFDRVSTDPGYRLYVHPKQAQKLFMNMIEGVQYDKPTKYLTAENRAKNPDEIGIIYVSGGVSIRVFKCGWMEEVPGATAGTANTAGMYNDGTGSQVFRAVLVGAEAWAMPAMGKKVEGRVRRKNGQLEAVEMIDGFEVKEMSKEPVPGANQDGLIRGVTYKFACGYGGATYSNGGFLVPQYDSTGTALYGAVMLHGLAEQ